MRPEALRTRRELLVARSARLRDEWVDGATELGARLSVVDRMVAAVRSGGLRSGLAGAAALFVVGRSGRVLRHAAGALKYLPWILPLLPRIMRLVRRSVRGRSSA